MSKFPPFKPQPKKGTCRERLGKKKLIPRLIVIALVGNTPRISTSN